mgnify:CR=1 FL=1
MPNHTSKASNVRSALNALHGRVSRAEDDPRRKREADRGNFSRRQDVSIVQEASKHTFQSAIRNMRNQQSAGGGHNGRG